MGKKSNRTSKQQNKKSDAKVFPSHLFSQPNIKLPYQKTETLLPGFIWVLRNFLSATDCQSWINYCEKECQLEHMQQRGTRYLAARECYRCSRDDPETAARLFARLQLAPQLWSILENFDDKQRPVACNFNLRLYKYTKGMSFGAHIDETIRIPDVGETRMTILIYLSDCLGGATRFLDTGSDNIAFEPIQGAILLHVHGDNCLLHQGDPVESGIKYVLRTDLVYSDK
jgi:hypothetical protein